MTRHLWPARWAGWFFAWVILLGQMAPAISGLLWHPAQMEVEICSVDGQRSIVLIDLESPAKPAATHGGHCPMCLAQHHTPGLLPADGLTSLPSPALTHVTQGAVRHLTAGRSYWAAANPRAPPRTHGIPAPTLSRA